MNKIEKFIENCDKIIAQDREKTLIALGLTEKEYAPDNIKSHRYPECAYVNGEKRYYREIAITVTDEEYARILEKERETERIREKEEIAKEKARVQRRCAKKWVPVFEKPVEEPYLSEKKEQTEETGKSNIASLLRTVAWVSFVLVIIGAIVTLLAAESVLAALLILLVGATEMLMLYALAAILDYLAELTAIARGGFRYTETNK